MGLRMTAQSRLAETPHKVADMDRIPQLYAVLGVIEQIAPGHETIEIPDEAALCHAYRQSSGIAKHGFGRTADETIAAATIGAKALIGKGENARAAAAQLSGHLRSQIVQLSRFVGI